MYVFRLCLFLSHSESLCTKLVVLGYTKTDLMIQAGHFDTVTYCHGSVGLLYIMNTMGLMLFIFLMFYQMYTTNDPREVKDHCDLHFMFLWFCLSTGTPFGWFHFSWCDAPFRLANDIVILWSIFMVQWLFLIFLTLFNSFLFVLPKWSVFPGSEHHDRFWFLWPSFQGPVILNHILEHHLIDFHHF